jgi:hypothetical protein
VPANGRKEVRQRPSRLRTACWLSRSRLLCSESSWILKTCTFHHGVTQKHGLFQRFVEYTFLLQLPFQPAILTCCFGCLAPLMANATCRILNCQTICTQRTVVTKFRKIDSN